MTIRMPALPPVLAEPRRGARTAPALLALALGGAALGTAEFASMGVLPSVAASFSITEPVAGIAISAYAVGVVVGAPVIAVLGSRVPRRSLLLVMMAVFAAAHLLSAWAPTFPVLVVGRFLGGLPHGAYFGVASLAAASLVPAARRGRAIATVMLGLTVANILGVPLSTAVGQQWGWRATFGVVAALGVATVLAVRFAVPTLAGGRSGSVLGELRALRSGRVWSAVAVTVVGFGGIFAVYTYISSTLTEVAGITRGWVPVVLAVFGLGMTVGAVLGGRFADRSVARTIPWGLGGIAVVMAAFTVLVHHPVPAVVGVFLLGAVSMVVMPSMQARLIDAAPEAPTLAASMLHSATNSANAIGAWSGGLVLSAGAGYAAIGWVGAALALGGLLLTGVSVLVFRRTPAGATPPAGVPRVSVCAG